MTSQDLARARAETLAKRPAEVINAVPIRLTDVRAVARPVSPRPPAAPGRLARFRAWRGEHYVADQALRVLAILAGAAATVCLAILALIWVGRTLFAEFGSPSIGLAIGAGVALVVALVAGAAKRAASSSSGHGRGYGFHYSKCKR